MEQNIQRQVQENMSQNQKDAFLREQVRVIQEELGEDGDIEIAAYRRQDRGRPPARGGGGEAAGRGHAPGKAALRLRRGLGGLRNYLDVCLGAALGRRDQGAGQRRGRPKDPGAGPLWLGEGQGAHPGVCGRPAAGTPWEGADLVPGWPSRRGQDLHRHVMRQGLESEAGPATPWAASTTRPTSGATGRPTSGLCPAASSTPFASGARETR